MPYHVEILALWWTFTQVINWKLLHLSKRYLEVVSIKWSEKKKVMLLRTKIMALLPPLSMILSSQDVVVCRRDGD